MKYFDIINRYPGSGYTPHPGVSPDAAKLAKFPPVPSCPHLCVDVPAGFAAVTLRTPAGDRVTLKFQGGGDDGGGSAQCVDIMYHDNGTTFEGREGGHPTTDVLVWTSGGIMGSYTAKASNPTLVTIPFRKRE